MSSAQHSSKTGKPRNYRLPLNTSLPYIYNWNSYDGLPVSSTDRLTWTSFPAGEPTAFLISAASKAEINAPAPINGESVPRPADTKGNPVDINIYSSERSNRPFDVAVSLVPQNTGPTPHVHWSDNEWFYVLAGSITLYVDHGNTPNYAIPGVDGTPLAERLYEIPVEAGQIVYGPSNMIHSFTNYSNEPAVWLTIWQRNQEELKGGISQFFTRGDIAPLVLDYDASVDYFKTSNFQERFEHWQETFPLYNVTISDNFGSYIASGMYDLEQPNQPGDNNPNVVKGAPQEVLDENNTQTLNSFFQNFEDLHTSIVRNSKTILIEGITGIQGLPINLEVAIGGASDYAASYGVFSVDNAKGAINGINPNDTEYKKNAKKILRPLYTQSSIIGGDAGEGVKTIAVETGDKLGFYKYDTEGKLILSTVEPGKFNLVNSAGGNMRSQETTVNARIKGAVAVLGDIISGYDKNYAVPIFDMLPLAKREDPVYAELTAKTNRPEQYIVGYYKVINESGDVLDSGGNIITPGSSSYAAAALSPSNLATSLNKSIASALNSGKAARSSFIGGEIYAPFVTVQKSRMTGNTYFAFADANPSGKSHIVSTGTNTFGFRQSASSKQFNDLGVGASFSLQADELHDQNHKNPNQQIEIQNYGLSSGSLLFYQINTRDGSVDGISPNEDGYLEAAYDWGKENDTIISYSELPQINEATSFDELGLDPQKQYAMLYVRGKEKGDKIKMLSSYADVNKQNRQVFSAYGDMDYVSTYGLDEKGVKGGNGIAAFNDLIITSSANNIIVLA
jgi:mannose-6-phosphate isomerase-like protein (cupin superfamily)